MMRSNWECRWWCKENQRGNSGCSYPEKLTDSKEDGMGRIGNRRPLKDWIHGWTRWFILELSQTQDG